MLLVACEGLMLALLILGAVLDIRSFRLPNWLTLSTAVVAVIHTLLVAAGWQEVVGPIAFGLGVLIAGFALHHFGLLGGGDVKWLAALAIWIGPGFAALRFLFIMGLAGGLLALVILIVGRIRPGYGRVEGRAHLPYGVAISLAGMDFLLRDGSLGQQMMKLWGA